MHFLALGLAVACCVVAFSCLLALIDDFRWNRLGVAGGAAAAAWLFRRRADDYDRYSVLAHVAEGIPSINGGGHRVGSTTLAGLVFLP